MILSSVSWGPSFNIHNFSPKVLTLCLLIFPCSWEPPFSNVILHWKKVSPVPLFSRQQFTKINKEKIRGLKGAEYRVRFIDKYGISARVHGVLSSMNLFNFSSLGVTTVYVTKIFKNSFAPIYWVCKGVSRPSPLSTFSWVIKLSSLHSMKLRKSDSLTNIKEAALHFEWRVKLIVQVALFPIR